MKGHSDSVDQLCWHPKNPNLLVTASGDKTIRVWDARRKNYKQTKTFLAEYLFSHLKSSIVANPY